MSDPRPGILITRPEPGASDTAARVADLGFRPVLAPLLEIRPQPVSLPRPERMQAILITSGNAIPALPATHHQVPLLAVGDVTAARARVAGFTRVGSADGDAHALAGLAKRSCEPKAGPLLLACGRGQGQPLAAELRAGGFRVIRRVVYAAIPAVSLPDPVRDAIAAGELAAVLVFSAETARQCVKLLAAARLHEALRSIDALAIGQAAGVALRALPWRRIRVADRPNQDAMLAMLR